MLQRFASALFGGNVEELSLHGQPEQKKRAEEEEDEDWILVNYLAEACSAQSGSGLPGSAAVPEEEEDLVMIPSATAGPPVRYASCTSLNSTADTDPDGRVEEEEDEEDDGFFRLNVGSLEESWCVTPPPCFTGRGIHPVLETSPLENLLIEHPSMSVYAYRSPPRLPLDPLPHSLDLGLGLMPDNTTVASTSRRDDVKKAVWNLERRPEAAIFQRHSAARYSAARAGLLRQRLGGCAQSTPPLSRSGLRRLNLLRPPKANAVHLHQPSQRHLNF